MCCPDIKALTARPLSEVDRCYWLALNQSEFAVQVRFLDEAEAEVWGQRNISGFISPYLDPLIKIHKWGEGKLLIDRSQAVG